jgi:hypothetical protein
MIKDLSIAESLVEKKRLVTYSDFNCFNHIIYEIGISRKLIPLKK